VACSENKGGEEEHVLTELNINVLRKSISIISEYDNFIKKTVSALGNSVLQVVNSYSSNVKSNSTARFAAPGRVLDSDTVVYSVLFWFFVLFNGYS
jgi:hypothetical protein